MPMQFDLRTSAKINSLLKIIFSIIIRLCIPHIQQDRLNVCTNVYYSNSLFLWSGLTKVLLPHEGGEALNRLPRETVDAPSLEVSKARLDGTLNNLLGWKVSLPMAGVGTKSSFKMPFNSNHSIILGLLDKVLSAAHFKVHL